MSHDAAPQRRPDDCGGNPEGAIAAPKTNDAKKETVEAKEELKNTKLPFPYKLHEMLDIVDRDGNSGIVSWLPHGNCFRVHKIEEFVTSIMPFYFHQSKFTSFTRQLYIYGFQKVLSGPDKGAFFHSQFKKNSRWTCLSIKRKPDKTPTRRGRSDLFNSSSIVINYPIRADSVGGGGGESGQRLFSSINCSLTMPSAHAQIPPKNNSMIPMVGSRNNNNNNNNWPQEHSNDQKDLSATRAQHFSSLNTTNNLLTIPSPCRNNFLPNGTFASSLSPSFPLDDTTTTTTTNQHTLSKFRNQDFHDPSSNTRGGVAVASRTIMATKSKIHHHHNNTEETITAAHSNYPVPRQLQQLLMDMRRHNNNDRRSTTMAASLSSSSSTSLLAPALVHHPQQNNSSPAAAAVNEEDDDQEEEEDDGVIFHMLSQANLNILESIKKDGPLHRKFLQQQMDDDNK